MDVTKKDIQKSKEINLDMAGFLTGDESNDDRERKDRTLLDVNQLKEEIIQTRMAVQNYGLSVIEAQIWALQDERTDILFGPITKEELLAKTKEIVQDRKKMALMKLLFMPLSVSKEKGFMPFMHTTSDRPFKEKDLWDLFFVAITDQDLEAVIAQMPDVGLSQAERQARIKEINAEIEKLNGLLNDDLAKAKKELNDRHIREASDRDKVRL